MAGLDEGSFQSWLSTRLRDLNTDEEVFSPYILSILEEAGDDGDDAEVMDSLADVLEGLGLDESLSEDHADSPSYLKKQIWSQWRKQKEQEKMSQKPEVDAASAVSADIKNQLASITEKRTEAYAATKASKAGASQSEIEARQAVKAAIMSKYENGEIEVTDDEGSDNDDGGGGDDGDLGMLRNTNAEAVAKADEEKREKGRLAAAAKKEKDKEDREKQKKMAEDKKKKAQEKSAKSERRR